jgi:hypothetical protein
MLEMFLTQSNFQVEITTTLQHINISIRWRDESSQSSQKDDFILAQWLDKQFQAVVPLWAVDCFVGCFG